MATTAKTIDRTKIRVPDAESMARATDALAAAVESVMHVAWPVSAAVALVDEPDFAASLPSGERPSLETIGRLTLFAEAASGYLAELEDWVGHLNRFSLYTYDMLRETNAAAGDVDG